MKHGSPIDLGLANIEPRGHVERREAIVAAPGAGIDDLAAHGVVAALTQQPVRGAAHPDHLASIATRAASVALSNARRQ